MNCGNEHRQWNRADATDSNICDANTTIYLPEPAGAKDKHDGKDGGGVGDQSQRGAQVLQ